MSDKKVLILMGGKSDSGHAARIIEWLNKFGISSQARVASAHKTPGKLLGILVDAEKKGSLAAYITIAGLSNALSGMVDFSTSLPVIACPPPCEAFGGADIYSSLRMPPGVAAATVLDPRNAALFVAKLLAVTDPRIKAKVEEFQKEARAKIEVDDAGLEAELYPEAKSR